MRGAGRVLLYALTIALALRSRVSATLWMQKGHILKAEGIIGHCVTKALGWAAHCLLKKEWLGHNQLSCIAVSLAYRLNSTRLFSSHENLTSAEKRREAFEIHGPQPCIQNDNMLCYFYRLNGTGQ